MFADWAELQPGNAKVDCLELPNSLLMSFIGTPAIFTVPGRRVLEPSSHVLHHGSTVIRAVFGCTESPRNTGAVTSSGQVFASILLGTRRACCFPASCEYRARQTPSRRTQCLPSAISPFSLARRTHFEAVVLGTWRLTSTCLAGGSPKTSPSL